jgi:DNA-binding NtrC family response regulator
MNTQAGVPHLLLIDDSPEIHDLIGDLLEDEPIRLTARLEAGLVIDEVIRLAPDLIMFDSRPGSEGKLIQLLSEAAHTLHVPLILCTGAVQDEIDQMIEEISPISLPVIRKPFDIDTVFDAIRDGLDRESRTNFVPLPKAPCRMPGVRLGA